MTERGRSLTEMLGTLSIMGILSVVGIWGYRHIVNSHDANTILHDINMMAHTCAAQLVMMDRTECALSDFSNKIDDKYPVSAQRVNQDYFKLVVSNIPQSICQELLNKGMPLASQIIPFTCVETNQFEWTFHKNLEGAVSTKFCHSDLDCNVCGVCQIADGQSQGICIGSCATPAHACETNEDCNTENECMVCNLETHTCQDGCQRVEYLESSGTQYIDTGVLANGSFDAEHKIKTDPTNTRKFIVAGTRTATQHLNFGQFEPSSKNFILAYLGTWWTINNKTYPNTEYETKVHYKSGNQYAVLNGETIGNASLTGTEQLDINIYLFKRNFYNPETQEDIQPMIGRMYYFKMWNNGTLIRDFVPILSPESSKGGGEACMFDKVTKKLFCNAGSGNFKTNKD